MLLWGLPCMLLALRLGTVLLTILITLVLLIGARGFPLDVRLAGAFFRMILLLLGHVCLSFHEWPRVVGRDFLPLPNIGTVWNGGSSIGIRATPLRKLTCCGSGSLLTLNPCYRWVSSDSQRA